MSAANGIKAKCVVLMLKEIFTHIHQEIYEGHVALVKENNQLRNTQALFFSYNGMIYPFKTPNGSAVPTKVVAPPLFCTLIDKLDKVNKTLENADENRIKNFLTMVMTNSFHGMTLKACLPQVLINHLEAELSPAEFKFADKGALHGPIPQTVEDTQCAIDLIHEHYGDTMQYLREVLMDKLLLAG